jgi:hypothetical protein
MRLLEPRSWHRVLGCGHPNRKEPSDPQHHGVEREKDDETGVATKLTLDNEPDEIVSKVTDKYKADVVDDQRHNALPGL